MYAEVCSNTLACKPQHEKGTSKNEVAGSLFAFQTGVKTAVLLFSKHLKYFKSYEASERDTVLA